MDIGSLLEQTARNNPSKLAITCEDRNYNYCDFNKQVNRLANGLLNLDIQKGDKVALMMKNSDFFVFSYFAAAKIGAVVVPVNFRLTAIEVNYILQQSESVLVICDNEFEELFPKATENTNVRSIITIGEPENDRHLAYHYVLSTNDQDPEVHVLETDDLEILYTSGTTGRPKGALFDHRRIFNVNLTMITSMGINKDDRFLHIAPLFHSAQLNLFLVTGVILGASHVIHREFRPETTLEAIEKYKITHFFGVPAMYNFLLQVPNVDDYDVSSIVRCGYGAAPMAPEIVRQSMQLFETDRFFNLCGLTEAGPGGIGLGPEGHKNHIGKGGKPFFLTEARVVNELGQDVEVGEVGEFLLRGETIMKGYYNKPEETKQAIREGWLYTGDLAKVDEEGHITLVDRKKDMIISGGENIYSIEVEQVMYEHPQVLEVAVVGTPHEIWGEIVTAIVVPKKGEIINEQELLDFCREKLAGYKIPKKVMMMEQLPRNASGKTLKYKLRNQFKKIES
ncbi:long-chain-fatty-acid--CoA ligase [Bacillus solimangrovi]|uniref:Long-chain fatty acid--CoA ligase n=1 Tax=Bacillus solimangrovi TaxID=1305675 RepID=A0A1E5LIU9_9BACI|nr:long-chain-fatty-acid--CoA ligase [Bacillus solimangrovi]OEH94012.1 long-chain fatty acid--CoA ligase [Bacillus solimangrovi]